MEKNQDDNTEDNNFDTEQPSTPKEINTGENTDHPQTKKK